MMKALILLAGSPGTGKTYLDGLIRSKVPELKESSIDVFKENLYDEIGFNSLEERNELDKKAYDYFYKEIDAYMQKGASIISDYPFSYRQHDILRDLSKKYGYQVITITLTADVNVLYERRLKRDLSEERHLGHVMTHYHKGDKLADRKNVEIKASRSEVEKFNKMRKYDEFELGTTIKVDVSDFNKVDYSDIIKKVEKLIS